MFLVSTMVMVTIALVMAVIVTNIYTKKESPERAPDWCVAIVSRFYPKYFRSYNETGSRLSKAARKRKNRSLTATCNVQLLHTSPIPSEATLENTATGSRATQKPEVVIETGNEIMQHASDSNGNGNGNNRSPEVIMGVNRYDYVASENNNPDVGEIPDRKRSQDKHDRQRFELEWKLIAKFTDRVFFWIFLVLSVCVQIVLILEILPIRSRKSV